MEPLGFVGGLPKSCPLQSRARAIISSFTWYQAKMAASFFNRIAALGLGLAGIGGVVNTALFNG